MLDKLQGRGVPGRGGPGPRITCPRSNCDGVLYQIQEGELLQKSPRPGWTKVERNCECPACGYRQKITLQVRESSPTSSTEPTE